MCPPKYATTEHIYLSNGGDHLEPPSYLSKVLKAASACGCETGACIIPRCLPDPDQIVYPDPTTLSARVAEASSA